MQRIRDQVLKILVPGLTNFFIPMRKWSWSCSLPWACFSSSAPSSWWAQIWSKAAEETELSPESLWSTGEDGDHGLACPMLCHAPHDHHDNPRSTKSPYKMDIRKSQSHSFRTQLVGWCSPEIFSLIFRGPLCLYSLFPSEITWIYAQTLKTNFSHFVGSTSSFLLFFLTYVILRSSPMLLVPRLNGLYAQNSHFFQNPEN